MTLADPRRPAAHELHPTYPPLREPVVQIDGSARRVLETAQRIAARKVHVKALES